MHRVKHTRGCMYLWLKSRCRTHVSSCTLFSGPFHVLCTAGTGILGPAHATCIAGIAFLDPFLSPYIAYIAYPGQNSRQLCKLYKLLSGPARVCGSISFTLHCLHCLSGSKLTPALQALHLLTVLSNLFLQLLHPCFGSITRDVHCWHCVFRL